MRARPSRERARSDRLGLVPGRRARRAEDLASRCVRRSAAAAPCPAAPRAAAAAPARPPAHRPLVRKPSKRNGWKPISAFASLRPCDERVRHALGAEREPARRQIQARVADVEREVPVEHVEPLILLGVDVPRRPVGRAGTRISSRPNSRWCRRGSSSRSGACRAARTPRPSSLSEHVAVQLPVPEQRPSSLHSLPSGPAG